MKYFFIIISLLIIQTCIKKNTDQKSRFNLTYDYTDFPKKMTENDTDYE